MEEKIVREIMEENEDLFTSGELEIIKKDFSIVKKIYLIGLINGREIYEK